MVNKDLNILLATKMLKKIIPLCIFLPKMSAYRKDIDETKYISFLIKDEEWLKKYNEIWEKVKNFIKKEFDSEPVYNEKCLEAKIESFIGKTNAIFHKTPKKGCQFICLSVILIDFIFRTSKHFYTRVVLEECKYVAKEIKNPRYIIDDIEISSDSDRENSDEEN